MKKAVFSMVFASSVLGAASLAMAGAYGEAAQPEEIPAAVPAPPAPEPEPERIMREFSGFLTDAETTRGLWAEVGSMYAAEYHPAAVGDTEAVNTYARVSYGQEMFEVGLLAPYIYAHQEGIGGYNENDFGDLKLWGKVMPLRTDMVDVGGGLVMSFPTAGSGIGVDEYGFNPFLTAAVDAGPASIRGTIGYNVYTGGDDVNDTIEYNVAGLIPVCESAVARVELAGQHWVESDTDPVSLFPGIDVSVPVGDNLELLLRPTLGIGLTQAPDWQLGMGIALNVGGI